jgi:hypothetical protein
MMKELRLVLQEQELHLPTKDGKFNTKTSLQLRPRDSTRNSDTQSIDHSTLSQDSQPTEFLNTEVDISYISSNG